MASAGVFTVAPLAARVARCPHQQDCTAMAVRSVSWWCYARPGTPSLPGRSLGQRAARAARQRFKSRLAGHEHRTERSEARLCEASRASPLVVLGAVPRRSNSGEGFEPLTDREWPKALLVRRAPRRADSRDSRDLPLPSPKL